MAADASQVRVGVGGKIYVAPVGTAAPTTTAAAWGAGWTDCGYCTPAGPAMSPKSATKDIEAWQAFYPVRTLQTGKTDEWKFTLLQSSGFNLKLAMGGGTITSLGGGDFKYVPPTPGLIDERAVGIEVQDGTTIDRYIAFRMFVTGVGDINFKRDDAVNYDITLRALQPASGDVWEKISNDPWMAS